MIEQEKHEVFTGRVQKDGLRKGSFEKYIASV